MKLNRESAKLLAAVPSQTLNDRVREVLKDQKTAKKVSERDLAAWLGWSQPKVAQKLGGRTEITCNELEALCQALDLSPLEAVRDRGLEFAAELTPTELRILEKIRSLDPTMKQAILVVLNVQKASAPERFATNPAKPIKTRLRNP